MGESITASHSWRQVYLNMLSNYPLLLMMAMDFNGVNLCCPNNHRVSSQNNNKNNNNGVSSQNNNNGVSQNSNNNRLLLNSLCHLRPPPMQSRCCGWRHSYSYAPTRICWSLPFCRTCTCVHNCNRDGRNGKSLFSGGGKSKKVVDSEGRQFRLETN